MSAELAEAAETTPRKWKPYPEYKPSGVEWLGEIPSHWKTKPLKRLISNQIVKGEERALPFIALEFIEPMTGRVVSNFEWRDVAADEYAVFAPNDVLFGKLRPYLRKHILADREGCCPTELLVLRAMNDSYLPSYLHYLVQSDPFVILTDATSYGTKMPRTSWEKICSNYFWIPPLSEQREIVIFLDRETAKIDSLVAKREELIALIEEKRKAIISHSITKGLNPDAPMKDSGVESLGRIPAHWTVKRLKYLTKHMTAGPFGSSLTKDMYTGSGYKIYGQEQVIPADFSIGDYYIPEQKYLEMKGYAISPGDVLISCVGTFGKIALVPFDVEPGIINPRLAKLEPDRKIITSAYLGSLLKSSVAFDQMEQLSHGGTMGVLNLGLLAEIKLPLPPIEEQRAITDEINDITGKLNALIAKIRLSIRKLQERRTALISAAVTGKIDVRGEVG